MKERERRHFLLRYSLFDIRHSSPFRFPKGCAVCATVVARQWIDQSGVILQTIANRLAHAEAVQQVKATETGEEEESEPELGIVSPEVDAAFC